MKNLGYLLFYLVLGGHLFGADIVRYAKHFDIQEVSEGVYQLDLLNPWPDAGESFRYVLVKEGSTVPEALKKEQMIRIPIQRTITLSTTYIANIDVISAGESIVGVASFNDINTQNILDLIEHGGIEEVGRGNSTNIEQMVALEPDVVFAMALGDPEHDVHPMLERMGIVTALCSGWMEETALGRLEWLKFFGVFFDKLDGAIAYFDEREQEYLDLVELVKSVQYRPTVLCNLPWGSSWYVPGGHSYVANGLKDAGGAYLWNDLDSNGSVPLDFETVYLRGLDTDYWIGTHSLTTIEQLKNSDERFADFKALREGKVYNSCKRVNEHGGNDIWERGVVHPEEVLADFIKILHPELLPDHEFVFYEQLK